MYTVYKNFKIKYKNFYYRKSNLTKINYNYNIVLLKYSMTGSKQQE